MKKGMTPQKQLMLEFRNSEEQFIISNALCAMNNEVQEEMATALVAYLRFGIKRDSFTNPFVQGVFDNLVSYLDFTRGEAEKVATDQSPEVEVVVIPHLRDLNKKHVRSL